NNILVSAAATSATDAWAVGFTLSFSPLRIGNLIEHWDGTSWAIVPSAPVEGVNSVTALSATNAWAVGNDPSSILQILHWDGTSWQAVPSPAPLPFGTLPSVSPPSASNAWIAGYNLVNGQPVPYTEHWNGTSWTA